MLHNLTILDKQPSLLHQFMTELRDNKIQQDKARFRNNLQRIGEIMAYEISKSFSFQEITIKTPLGNHSSKILGDQPVLITIFRAGMPLYQGFLHYFDHAPSGFFGASRTELEKRSTDTNNSIEVNVGYEMIPAINGKTVIVIDPMLATGNSMKQSIERIYKNGTPKHLIIAAVVAAPEGIDFLKKNLDVDFSLFVVSVDKGLTENSFIYPGLGDAGNLAFGQPL